MKIYLQWKDPDIVDAKTGEYVWVAFSEETRKILTEMGMREYLVVEFDTDTRQSRVVDGKKNSIELEEPKQKKGKIE